MNIITFFSIITPQFVDEGQIKRGKKSESRPRRRPEHPGSSSSKIINVRSTRDDLEPAIIHSRRSHSFFVVYGDFFCTIDLLNGVAAASKAVHHYYVVENNCDSATGQFSNAHSKTFSVFGTRSIFRIVNSRSATRFWYILNNQSILIQNFLFQTI